LFCFDAAVVLVLLFATTLIVRSFLGVCGKEIKKIHSSADKKFAVLRGAGVYV
jgi:hypothetical protein